VQSVPNRIIKDHLAPRKQRGADYLVSIIQKEEGDDVMNAPRTTILRPDDLIFLDFEFINLTLQTGDKGSPELVPVPNETSYIVVHFPPQNIGEQAFFEVNNNIDLPTNDPDANNTSEMIGSLPVQSRMSGPSRLVFEVPKDAKILYTIQGLLDWKNYRQRVAPTALPPGEVGDRPAIQDPRSINPPVTALELPHRLVISPDENARWIHSQDLVTYNGRTELWHTRLGITQEGEERENFDNAGTVRAIWSPDYDPNNPPVFGQKDGFRTSLTPSDRHQIVRLSSDYNIKNTANPPLYYDPSPIYIERLMLSSLGAWINAIGVWEDPTDRSLRTILREDNGLIINEWRHAASQGRDQYARVVYQGCLFPFGHLASLVKITERKIVDIKEIDRDNPVAYLSQKMYLIVRQPEVNYPDALYGITKGRDNPFRKSIKITTQATPNIEPPNPIDDTGAFWVKVKANGSPVPFPFHIIAEDEEGQSSEFMAALIFVPIDKCANWGAIKKVRDYYINTDDRKCNLHGQKVAFAKSNKSKGGDTTLITEEIFFDVREYQSGPPYYLPIFDKASVRIPAVEQLLGMSKPTFIKQSKIYLDSKGLLGEEENRAGVFAEIIDGETLPISIPPEKAGGLASPNMNVKGLSQDLGPVAGDLNDLARGEFKPESFFPKEAKLLGGLSLKDLIAEYSPTSSFEYEKFKSGFPKIISRQDPPSGIPTSIITTLDWSPGVKSFGPFEPGEDASMEIRAQIEKKLDASEPKNSIDGRLSNFDLSFAKAVRIQFKSLNFKARSGHKMDVSADVKGVSFEEGGPLYFVNNLAQYLPSSSSPGFGDSASLDVSKDEVTVGYTLGLPPIATGVFALQDVRLSAGLSLPFKSDKTARLRFDFSERHHPFLLTVSMFAGGGFLGINLGPDGIQTIEGALEFGGNMALNLGVASGGVYVMGGIYYKRDISTPDNKVILEGYLRCGGCLVVLGIVSVCVEFRLGLRYDVKTNKVWGVATLTVEVETLFFSKTVNLKLERTFAGAGGDLKLQSTFAGAGGAPTFRDQVPSINVWKEYAEAFA